MSKYNALLVRLKETCNGTAEEAYEAILDLQNENEDMRSTIGELISDYSFARSDNMAEGLRDLLEGYKS